MNKMKTRYKVLLLNVILSLLYYASGWFYFSLYHPNGVGEFFTAFVNVIIFLSFYNLINLIWIGLIIYGKIKKNKEIYYGGIYSLALSITMFICLFVY